VPVGFQGWQQEDCGIYGEQGISFCCQKTTRCHSGHDQPLVAIEQRPLKASLQI
jgi:hypothetical protein